MVPLVLHMWLALGFLSSWTDGRATIVQRSSWQTLMTIINPTSLYTAKLTALVTNTKLLSFPYGIGNVKITPLKGHTYAPIPRYVYSQPDCAFL